MVATILRLRYRILANNLTRSPWQLVGFCFGALGALSLLALLTAGAVAAGLTQQPSTISTIAVLGGSLLLLGWVVAPVLVAGLDTSIDAARLAPFPLSRRRMMLALAVSGISGIPGITTTLAAAVSVLLWMRWPVAAVVAVPCVLVAVAMCVLASQLVSTLSVGLGGNRRGRELIGTLVLAVLIMSGPIITGVLSLADRTAGLGERFSQVAAVLGWTPLGAAWSVPAEIATGAWGVAAAKLAVALGSLVLVWVVWERTLEGTIASPPRTTSRAAKPGALGLFGRMPSGPVGATWARALHGWIRDPRYIRQLLVVPLLPVLFAFVGGTDGLLFVAAGVVVALVLAISTYADVSYDGTAFALVLATGVRGRDDRLGRMLGAGCIGVPLVVAIAVITTAVASKLELLPGVLAAGLGLLLAGYAVTAVSSAIIVAPVAAAGDSPFKTVPGQTFVSGLLVFVVMGAIVLVASPALVTALIALVSDRPALGWAAMAVALLVGIGACVAGVVIGGRQFDRRGPELLQRIRSFPAS